MLLATGAAAETARERIAAPNVPALRSAVGMACPIAPAVICAIVLSLPLGIVAMLYSLSSRAALCEGDLAAAARAKRRSTLFCWLSVASAAFMVILFLILTTS